MRRLLYLAFVVITILTTLVSTSPGTGDAQTTWGRFAGIQAGVTKTVPLGEGSTVDVLVTTEGTKGLWEANFENEGTTETGLQYDSLTTLGIFNGGGSGSVTTIVNFSNFTSGINHETGYIFVGGIASTGIVSATSTIPGLLETWIQVGNIFVFGNSSNIHAITWDESSGEFISTAQQNSKGIVVNIGNISQYDEIKLICDQYLDDGIYFSMGESVAYQIPALHPIWGSTILVLVLIALSIFFLRKIRAV